MKSIIIQGCLILFVTLAIRSLILAVWERKPWTLRLLDLIFAALFTAIAAFLFVFGDLHWPPSTPKILLEGIIPLSILLLLSIRLRKPYRPRPVSFLLKLFFVIVLSLVTLSSIVLDGFLRLYEDRPVVKVKMTGKWKQELIEWKPPNGSLQRQELPEYEILIETRDGANLSDVFLYGDQVALKARVIRFRPTLYLLGATTLCRIDFLYNGYTTASRHNFYPHHAVELQWTNPSLKSFQNKFWDWMEDYYQQESESALIRSVTVESSYFPLVDREGRPFRGAYFLTVNPGGLSAIPIPNEN
jgi:hypothetical protein